MKTLRKIVTPLLVTSMVALGGCSNKDIYSQHEHQRGKNVKNGVYLDKGSSYLVVAEVKDETGKRIPKSKRNFYIDWNSGDLNVRKDGRVDMVDVLGENPLKKARIDTKIKRYSFQIDDIRKDQIRSHIDDKLSQEDWVFGRGREETKILQEKFDELQKKYYETK